MSKASGHFIEYCKNKKCNTILGQCRCIDQNKTEIRERLCPECQVKLGIKKKK